MNRLLIEQLKNLREAARDEGIDINPNDSSIFRFRNGVPISKKQKKVANIYDDMIERGLNASTISRRSFIRSPMAVIGGMAALSTGLGFSLYPKTARADTAVPQPVTGIVFANPTLPMREDYFSTVPKAQEDFSTKVAVVVGGSTGMGFEHAKYLKNVVGFGTVIVTSRFNRSHYPDFPNNIIFKRCDVTKKLHRIAFHAYLKLRYGQIDLLHLNAGRIATGTPLNALPERIALQQDTNYFGSVELFKMLEHLYPATGYARLIVTSSIVNDEIVIPYDGFGQFIGFDDNKGVDSFSYTETKRRLSAFCQILVATIRNSQLTIEGVQWPQVRNPDLKVSIVHPPAVNTPLGTKGFLLEDTPFAEQSLQTYVSGLVTGGISQAAAGHGMGQLSQIENPPLYNYILDQDADPQLGLVAAQELLYRLIGYESNISVRADANAWPPF